MAPVLTRRRALGVGALAALAAACTRTAARAELVLKHQPLGSDPRPLADLLARFERDNPGVRVRAENLPNASDTAHQFFLTALGGGAQDFDAFVVDVIWVREFARAGWIADLSRFFPPEALAPTLFPAVAHVVIDAGRTMAVPWYLDAGLLYYRTDLVPRAPRTYDELARFARDACARQPALHGYLWQGLQYEGLVCNGLEAVWGHGGDVALGPAGHVHIDSPEARAALAYLRGLLATGLSPPSVTSATEDESRRTFERGGAAFLRGWPFAWASLQRGAVRGRVGIAPLPTLDGRAGQGALGGYQLAVNAHVPAWRQALAARLIAHLTTPEAYAVLAAGYGLNPPRPALYADRDFARAVPSVVRLLPLLTLARPRPVTPFYPVLSDALQGEFSAAIAGLRPPGEALARAQARFDRAVAGLA